MCDWSTSIAKTKKRKAKKKKKYKSQFYEESIFINKTIQTFSRRKQKSIENLKLKKLNQTWQFRVQYQKNFFLKFFDNSVMRALLKKPQATMIRNPQVRLHLRGELDLVNA